MPDVRGGTVLERLVAYYGISLRALAAGGSSVIGVKVVLHVTGTSPFGDDTAVEIADSPLLLFAFVAAFGVDFVLSWRSDPGPRLAARVAASKSEH
jgi:hypothetical protein